MPDKWGRSTGSEIVDRALWRLQRVDRFQSGTPGMLVNKIAAARLIGAKDEDIAVALDVTVDELKNFMEAHSGTVR